LKNLVTINNRYENLRISIGNASSPCVPCLNLLKSDLVIYQMTLKNLKFEKNILINVEFLERASELLQ